MSQAEQDTYSSIAVIWIIAHFLLDLWQNGAKISIYCIMTLFLVILKLTLYEDQSVIAHDEYVFIRESNNPISW